MSTSTSPSPVTATPTLPRSFLTVIVGGGHFAIDAAGVAEVLRIVAVTPTTGAPDWVLGAINLRGQVVPVVDARVWLRREAPLHLSTPMLIVRTPSVVAAVVVDEVRGIEAEVGAPSSEAEGAGVVELAGRLWSILDIGELLDGSIGPRPT